MSWGCAEDIYSVTIFYLPRRLEDLLKTSWRRIRKKFWTHLQDVKKSLHWRRLQYVFKTCFEDVFKTFCEYALKTSRRSANVCLGVLKGLFHLRVLFSKRLISLLIMLCKLQKYIHTWMSFFQLIDLEAIAFYKLLKKIRCICLWLVYLLTANKTKVILKSKL